MNIRLIYHSSTGNTEKLAQAIANTLGIEPEKLNTEMTSFDKPVDLLFIGDGIYAGKASSAMLSFIDRLDPQIVKNAAVFATYGGQAKIGDDIKKRLQEKNLNVIGTPFTCKGQAWFFINRHHPNENDIQNAQEYVKKIIAEITDAN